MHSFKSLVFHSLAIVALVSASNTTGPVVDLGYAKYRGIHNDSLGIDSFYGIRFAAPPTGPLRWRAAVPIESRNNYTLGKTLDASVPGPQCVQLPLDGTAKEFIETLAQAIPGFASASADVLLPRNNSEDCLLLDVIVPSKPKAGPLPVVIQIHGGGYTTGNSFTGDGSQFVSYSKGNVVWVQIQYRLGAYGFLGAKEVLADGDPNLGLLDQRVAFDWVQNHIHNFGGDPNKVTIWGGSAGGGSVMNHLIINSTVPKIPFRAAIAEFPWWQPYHDTPVLEAQYQQLLNASGCHDLSCLRRLPEDALANATFKAAALIQSQGTCGNGDNCYGPYVDGKVIRDLPSNEFKEGNFHKVPLITDHNSKEAIFQDPTINSTAATTADVQKLFPAAEPAFFDRLYQVYNTSSFTGSFFKQPFFGSQIYGLLSSVMPTLRTNASDPYFWQLEALFSDFIIKCPTYYMNTAASDAAVPNWKLNCDSGIYLHGAASVYTIAASAASGNATLGNIMKDWFLSFVVNMDPNSLKSVSNSSRPQWPQYLQGGNGSQFRVMQLEDTGVSVQPDGDASERCDFFHSQSYVVRN